MDSISTIKNALFQLMYSVIETGVCRVIVSKSTRHLLELKTAYIENLPENHKLIFIAGKIENLDALTNALEESGVNEFSNIESHSQFLEQAKLYLIANKGEGITTIWAFENADLVSNEMHKLLSQLLLWQSLGNSLLTIELWGHSLLLNSFNSGEVNQYYSGKTYLIRLNDNPNQRQSPCNNNRSIYFKLAITLVIGLVLGNQLDPLLKNISIGNNISEQQSINLLSKIKANSLTEQPSVADAVIEERSEKRNESEIFKKSNIIPLIEKTVFEKKDQKFITEVINNNDEKINVVINRASDAEQQTEPEDLHWYFTLLPDRWLSEYNVNLHHQIQRKNTQYYIQYGVYRNRSSILKFIKRNRLLSDYFHLCYSADWQMVALMTGAYQGYRQAFQSFNQLKEKGFEGTIVNSNYLSTWQCSNE